jgi:quinol monooxygenase YgiN
MKLRQIPQTAFLIIMIVMATLIAPANVSAQNKTNYMRIARIVVDATKLESYKAALKEGMEAAVAKEPGVLSLYAVYEKNDPAQVTVFEMYADENAYQLHIQTAHFKKYKATAEGMVKSLVLVDVDPIALAAKKR